MALMEVCIAACDSQSENTKEGDIIDIRAPLGYVGTKEQHEYIWLLIDDSELPARSELRDLTGARKYKYNIPLASLGIDIDRARDRNDRYQPFITVGARGAISNPQVKSVVVEEKR